MLGDGDARFRLAKLLPDAAAIGRSVFVTMAATSGFGVIARLLDKLCGVGQAHEQRHDDDQHHAADPFRGHELPAHEDQQNEAQFDDEVGRSELEGEAWDKCRALLEERAADRGGGVGAAGAGCTKRGCESDLLRPACPSADRIRFLETTACSTAEIRKPSTRLQPVFQNMPNAIRSAWPIGDSSSMAASLAVAGRARRQRRGAGFRLIPLPGMGM